MAYLLGRGCVYIGLRNGAEILAVEKFHTVSFELTTENDYAEHMNSCGALKSRDVRVPISSTAMAKIQIDEHAAKIIAKAIGGEIVADAGTTFTDLALPSGLSVGDIIPVPNGYTDLTTLTVEDDLDAALSENTNYTVNLAAGLITIVDLASFTQPLKVTGETKDGTDISIATQGSVERFVRFDGINIADENKPIIVDLFRGSFEPSNLPVKSDGDDFAAVDFEIPLLEDPNAPLDATLGKYGKYRLSS